MEINQSLKMMRIFVQRIRRANKAVSPAISSVIMMSITVTLVLVAGTYAYQALDRQQGATEFEAVNKSFLALDDAIRDVAWDLGSSRSARFSLTRGYLEILPDGTDLTIQFPDFPAMTYTNTTGTLEYKLSTRHHSLGEGYQSYLIGDENTVGLAGTTHYGQALITQTGGWLNLTLMYRVGVVNNINYVNILIIRLTAPISRTYTADFDTVAKNYGVTTVSYGPYSVVGGNYTMNVGLGDSTSSLDIILAPGDVVFNFVTAEVRVTS